MLSKTVFIISLHEYSEQLWPTGSLESNNAMTVLLEYIDVVTYTIEKWTDTRYANIDLVTICLYIS